MGGDQAPEIVVHGIDIAAERHPAARFLLVGDEAALAPLLQQYQARRQRLHGAPRARQNRQRSQAHRGAADAQRLDAGGDRRGRQRRGRRRGLRRQYRRAAGAGQDRHQDHARHRPPRHGGDRPLGARRRGDARPRRQRGLRYPQPGRVRRDGRRVRPHRAGPDRAHDRPAECRLRGAQGRRPHPRRRRCAARDPYRAAVPRLRRRPRHRRRHHRRHRHRRLHRQCRAEDHRRHRQAGAATAAAGLHRLADRPSSAICWRARSSSGCASWSTRGATMAP